MKVELIGLPGAGKSYCCKMVENETILEDKFSKYKTTFKGKMAFKLFLLFWWINPILRKKYNDVRKILGQEKKYTNCMNSNILLSTYLKYMLFVYFLEKEFDNIIIDEGVLHFCAALYAEFNLEIDKIERIYECLNVSTKVYYLYVDIKTVMCQIKKRNRKKTAIDFLDNNELKMLLERYLFISEYFCEKNFSQKIKVESFIERIKKEKLE